MIQWIRGWSSRRQEACTSASCSARRRSPTTKSSAIWTNGIMIEKAKQERANQTWQAGQLVPAFQSLQLSNSFHQGLFALFLILAPNCRSCGHLAEMVFLWRPSLVGWRPLLVGWRLLLLETKKKNKKKGLIEIRIASAWTPPHPSLPSPANRLAGSWLTEKKLDTAVYCTLRIRVWNGNGPSSAMVERYRQASRFQGLNN